jgi:hypothetical protein
VKGGGRSLLCEGAECDRFAMKPAAIWGMLSNPKTN